MTFLQKVPHTLKRRWDVAGKGLKVFLGILIALLAIVGFLSFLLWAFLKLFKPGKVGNLDLYFPRRR